MKAQEIDLKSIERKVWLRYIQDGLWDIYLGLLFLGLGLVTLADSTDMSEGFRILLYLGAFATAYAVFWAGKRFITMPRIGLVKFGPVVKERRMKASIVLTVSVLAGIALFILTIAFGASGMEWIRESYGAPIGANFVIVFSALAYFLRFPRLYMYGLLLGAAVPAIQLLREKADIPFPALIGFGAASAIILLVGVVVLARFIRSSPKPAVGFTDVFR